MPFACGHRGSSAFGGAHRGSESRRARSPLPDRRAVRRRQQRGCPLDVDREQHRHPERPRPQREAPRKHRIERVRAHYAETGFDPQASMRRWGVKAERGHFRAPAELRSGASRLGLWVRLHRVRISRLSAHRRMTKGAHSSENMRRPAFWSQAPMFSARSTAWSQTYHSVAEGTQPDGIRQHSTANGCRSALASIIIVTPVLLIR